MKLSKSLYDNKLKRAVIVSIVFPIAFYLLFIAAGFLPEVLGFIALILSGVLLTFLLCMFFISPEAVRTVLTDCLESLVKKDL